MLVTTLNKIKEYNLREDGWKTLLRYLEKTKADDDPLAFLTILESNGFDDALWCMRAAPEYEKEWRLFAIWCARQVQHLMTDERSIAALDVAEKYTNDDATKDELNSASAAASAEASAAASAAASAEASAEAMAAVRAEVRAEASAAVRHAASNAVRYAARIAASAAASNAVRYAVRASVSAAASAAASAEASAAAWATAWAAVSTEASAAAWATTRYAQKQQFIKIISGE